MFKGKFLLISIVIFFIFPIIAVGQIDNLSVDKNNQKCILDFKLKELQEVLGNQSLDYLSRFNKEIELRKEILKSIFDCLILEAKNYIVILEKLNITKPAVADMRSKLINELNKSIDYYQFRKSQISNLSLEGLKYAAKSLKDDREARFTPLNQTVNDFILWNKNEEFFNLAKNRILDIEKTIKIFKPEENKEIKDLFSNILNNFKLALNKHNEAWNGIDEFNHEKASNLIQESLSDLLGVYNLIYNLSKKTIDLISIKQ